LLLSTSCAAFFVCWIDVRVHAMSNGTRLVAGWEFYHRARRPRKVDADGAQIGLAERVHAEVRVLRGRDARLLRSSSFE
jgi:hypothetical protein